MVMDLEICFSKEGWKITMDETLQAKFDEKMKELIASAKKNKNVLEYQEITVVSEFESQDVNLFP